MKTIFMAVIILMVFHQGFAIGFKDDEANKLYQEAYNLVLDKSWSEAIEKFEMLLDKYSNSMWEDDARFWMCYALEQQNSDLEGSFGCFEDFVESYEDSKWRDDAIQNLTRLARELEKEGKAEYTLRVKTIQDDVNDELTLAAIQALSNRGDERAFESLINIYDSNKNDRIRKKMVYIIGSFENKASSEKLKDIARNDKNEDIRSEAIFWLADDSKTKETAEFLSNMAMSDPSAKVQKKAIFSLGDMDDNFGIPYLYHIAKEHNDENMRAEAVFWIGNNATSTESIKQLSGFAYDDPSEKIQKKAIFALSEAETDQGVDALISISKKHKNPEMRGYALFWLSQDNVTSKKINAIKEAAYNDADQKVQEKAVFALHELDKNKGLDDLINIAKNHKSTAIRKKAIFWLGESDDERAVKALEEILLAPKN